MLSRRGFYLYSALGLIAAGCGQELETGYKFHPLSSSDAERRSYYAPAFTPESVPPKASNNDIPLPSLGGNH